MTLEISGNRFGATVGEGRGAVTPAGPTSGKTFRDVLAELKSTDVVETFFQQGTFRSLTTLGTRLLTRPSVSPRELLLYQVGVSRFALGVELASKIAESLSSTVRKFQSNS